MRKRFHADRSGATAIEYSLIAALIAMAIVVAARQTGSAVEGLMNRVADEVTEAGQ
ncbi:Flp family type IVb pilin [Nitratireductor sp. ZSWI3]|nr:Flp family type IVb pilin [Nitratireductor sp. ZSWI3]